MLISGKLKKGGAHLKALKYKVDVYGSVLDFSHGFARTIEEVFVPEEKIIFNVVNSELHVWSESKLRCSEETQVQEITVDEEFVKQLQAFIKLKEECLTKATTCFNTETTCR